MHTKNFKKTTKRLNYEKTVLSCQSARQHVSMYKNAKVFYDIYIFYQGCGDGPKASTS